MKVFVFDLLAYGEQLDHLKVGSELPYPLSNRHFKSDVAVRTYAEHLEAWEELDKLGMAQFPLVIGGVVPVIHIDGIKPGDYVLAYTLHDNVGSRTTRVQQPFTIKAACRNSATRDTSADTATGRAD